MTAAAVEGWGDVAADAPAAAGGGAPPAASMKAEGSSKLACFSSSSIDAWSISASAKGFWPGGSARREGSGVAFGGCSAIGHHPWRANARALSWARRASANDRDRRKLEIRAERNALGHEHFLDDSFTEDDVELVLPLPTERFEPRFAPPRQLLRVALGNDR